MPHGSPLPLSLRCHGGSWSPVSTLSALGLTREEERLYQRLLPLSGSELETVAAGLRIDAPDLSHQLASLEDRGIVRVERGRVQVLSLAAVVAAFVTREAEATTRTRERLDGIAAAIPVLAAAATGPGPGEVENVRVLDGEVSTGGNGLQLLTKMVEESRGEMLWLRPDAWHLPRGSAVAEVVGHAIANGRRSRAIYPVRALHEARDVLLARARAGERIRVVSDLPTRMFVLGSTHAVVPEPLGMADEPRIVVRQPAIVEALTMLFELMWERAAPVPDLDFGEARPDLRRFLLQQLAAGARDEQIARALGISLRTERRRVAELLIELGVDTRFQAGVEAVRRGWL
jgi:predicted DNA-binding transcriptional regulator